jgi:hypothetical protein
VNLGEKGEEFIMIIMIKREAMSGKCNTNGRNKNISMPTNCWLQGAGNNEMGYFFKSAL